jgi:hypothetical protein
MQNAFIEMAEPKTETIKTAEGSHLGTFLRPLADCLSKK